MTGSATTAAERYPPWRRWIEIGFWPLATALNAVLNSVTVVMDLRRTGLSTRIAEWEPFVWEISSGVLWLSLIPVIVWFTRRYPLLWDRWRQWIPAHFAASIAISLVHVCGMVALRKLAYGALGKQYDFGYWPSELFYEYLKDVRTYLLDVFMIEAYRLFLRRLQGEVRLLDPPDEGLPAESESGPADRPKRFLVRKLRREFLIHVDDIEWLQATGNYVTLRVGQHDYLLRSTIAGIEKQLDPSRFARIHRSYIVSLEHAASIEPLDGGEARVHLRNGAVLPCSRRYRASLRERIEASSV
jgi:hypothetical protein